MAHNYIFVPFRERKLLAMSLLLMLGVRIGLWVLPFNFLERLLNSPPFIPDKVADWDAVFRVVRSVRACSRFVPYSTCLTQAIVTRALLRMRGQASDLRIGVEKDEKLKFAAHAWVEVDGRIVIGRLPHHRRFAVLQQI